MNQELLIQLTEIRRRLIFILIGFILIFAILFHFANDLYALVAKPILAYLPKNSTLIATDITSPFFAPLKLAAITAFILSLPNTLYQIWRYIAPALYKKERLLFVSLSITAVILFILGILFCYFLVLPVLFGFITHIKASEVVMMTDITKYLDFILTLFFIFGLCFETPIIIFLLIHFDFVSLKRMQNLRSYIFVGCFILAAVVTPPDVLSQTLLAIPLYLLYELGMLISRFTTKITVNTHIEKEAKS